MLFPTQLRRHAISSSLLVLFTSGFIAHDSSLAQSSTANGSDTAAAVASAAPRVSAWASPTATSLEAAGRLLNQATFGPTAADYYHVEQVGLAAYVTEQLNVQPYLMPATIPVVDYASNGGDCNGWSCDPEAWWWRDALFGNDQLRQRVAYALSKLFVVSYNEVDARYFPYYLNVLSKDAFGNWRTLMQDVATSGAMGTYLNSANSQAAPNGGHADENFAREMMQLFSIGTVALSQDGSVKTDAGGQPIPNYTAAIVQNFARAFTGYTFANDDCSQPTQARYYFWPQPPGQGCAMMPLDQYHDTSSKTLLRGQVLPSGQSAATDLSAAIDNVFEDPSLPPFVCRRLIQNLVKSNPTPGYISRIAALFINNGAGVRGDMATVIRGILLDPEARADDDPTHADPDGGVLRDPVLWWTSVLRAFQATQNLPAPFDGVYNNIFDLWLTDLGEDPHHAPSVFSFYAPDYTINAGSLNAPEFQLENSASLAWMMGHMQDVIDDNFGPLLINEFHVNVSATSPIGKIAAQQGAGPLVDALNALLLHGTMSDQMRSAIVDAVSPFDTDVMIRNAIFLVVTSPQYRVML